MEDGGPVVVTGGHMITIYVAQSIHMNGRRDMWIIRAFQRSVLEDINRTTRATRPSRHPDRLVICNLQVDAHDWLVYIPMCKTRTKASVTKQHYQMDKHYLKWIVIRHLPKGIVYSGGVNAMNQTKPPKTKRAHVLHYPIRRWHHSLPWLS